MRLQEVKWARHEAIRYDERRQTQRMTSLSNHFPMRVFALRTHSLMRGTVLVILGLGLAFRVSGFPAVRQAPALVLPLALTVWGSIETFRCLRRRWSLYHGSVLLLLYMDVLVLAMVLFLLVYPYQTWMQ
jgi:hypothetical protein